MSRKSNKFVIDILRPPALAIGFMVRTLYRLLYGWWGEKRFMSRQQDMLTKEIQDKFWFLFEQSGAQIVPNADIGHLAVLRSPVVTVSVDGMLLRFVNWRDNRQVHVASERIPHEWQEFSEVLNVIERDEVRQYSTSSFDYAARFLRDRLSLLKEAFSQERYPELKQQLENTHDYQRVVTKQWETEINRRLYPDR